MVVDDKMTPRQKTACASLILEILENDCALTIEHDEVTVYDDTIKTGLSPHAHHGAGTLYDRLAAALETAKGYAANRKEIG